MYVKSINFSFQCNDFLRDTSKGWCSIATDMFIVPELPLKGPVKVSKELLITCGECSTREKMRKSAISMYNVVAAASLYKCHNHYNGCKAILKFGANHTECERKTYCCPKCSYKGTGIQLKNHFKSSHIENLYFSNKFTFTSKQPLEEIFLFSTENYLYALTIENTFIKAINICEHPLLNEVTLHFSNISKLMYCSITCPSELNVPLNELIFVEVHLNRQRSWNITQILWMKQNFISNAS